MARPNEIESNPYRPPESALEEQRVATDDIDAFVGERSSYYLSNWSRLGVDQRLGYAGFNWAAAFWSSAWFFYRKMYWTGALVVAGYAALNLALGVYFVGYLGQSEPPQVATLVPVFVACGLTGNFLYFRRAVRVIRRVRNTEVNPERRREVLTRKGGTSVLAIVIGTIAPIGLIFLALMIFFALSSL